MSITTTINKNWNKYDVTEAKLHLSRYGVIFLDEYKLPIDNEYELEELSIKYLVENK